MVEDAPPSEVRTGRGAVTILDRYIFRQFIGTFVLLVAGGVLYLRKRVRREMGTGA